MSNGEASEFVVFQEDDILPGFRLAAIGAASIAVGAVGVFVAALILYVSIGAIQPSSAGPTGSRPAPRTIARIEQTPIWDARAGIDERRAQQDELNRLGWIDRGAGLAQIPIEDAIDILVETSK